MSRLLQRRGENRLASLTYERALSGHLPYTAERSAKRELALFAKRNGEFDRANRLWEELAEDADLGLEACEHLAIYYEHQARDFQRAARLAREALVKLRSAVDSRRISPETYRQWHARFQHRLNRLASRT